ncbi:MULTISPECIES: TcdA/TcdB pore-forming domain-containing protein [unclassified Pseudomonas]|uniref:TcdA/TcdB pore-forming domain-containing protein n=1 Tax=unclassified Pseudomonas TaxID=196821 RepID=UPI002AC8F1DC|nr:MULTISPECIES: TcdA/TcdB pore-forming domain-containing protein [unclassified Pseudomonas]MEB0046513.1 TcdA/TcdB pore-forming domain-containing protein [Pseudomonas sp. Dout3]MEB0097939.1 TcdA/TcdB pore-forming domain-containing protein [Pseudomonas sp. DC1.2]WPX59566.1 TcdA/TcdB pore-forming domain-containing protein [Pseudomonas sp. DC1.2]
MQPHKGTEQYAEIFRYYAGCISLLDSPALLEPLGLLKHSLAVLVGPAGRKRRTTDPESAVSPAAPGAEALTGLYEKIDGFQARVSASVEQMMAPALEVPKNLHFVWLGGGLGEVQRDYINIWQKVMVDEKYTLKLWYDSDALLAYETNRVIVEAAKADTMLADGKEMTDYHELADRYVERATVLKQQMYASLNDAVAKGMSADDARIELLVSAYGQKKNELENLRETNRRSIVSAGERGLELRDLAVGKGIALNLRDLYEREMKLRGNLAAASDVVRIEALFAEGGTYADVDCLPPFMEKMGGVDISGLNENAQSGVLQLLLDHNPEWMPSRQALLSQYTRYVEFIPEEHRVTLTRFAEGHPDLASVFFPPVERLVRPDLMAAVVQSSSLSNAFLMAHPQASILKVVFERFKMAYALLDTTATLAMERGILPLEFNRRADLAVEVLEKKLGALGLLTAQEDIAWKSLAVAVAGYYDDGIRPGSENTILLTGPTAMREAMREYQTQHFPAQLSRELWTHWGVAPHLTVNTMTEEGKDNSWKEDAFLIEEWLDNEKARDFKVSYRGSIASLLKHQTVEFENGWPVIEGRHVLKSEILQHLSDELGPAFLKAMNTLHDHSVVFDKPLSLSFDQRQAILAQDPALRPPGSQRDAKTQALSMDSLFEGLAEGTLVIEQLSPAQRLWLGAMLGLDSLDNRTFEAHSSEFDNLANRVSKQGVSKRYAVYEEQLLKTRSPAFIAGLQSQSHEPVGVRDVAFDLKKAALEQSLTLRQWGQTVARVERLAKLEYRGRVKDKVASVLGGIEGLSFKLVPQDLLLRGAGDTVAARCYPLTMLMAAAFAQGPQARTTLRERFYTSVIEPDSKDSLAFLHVIEHLRDVPTHEVGIAHGQSSIKDAVALLKTRPGNSTLMLNSANHAMLLAKTVEGGQEAYHFYDPNITVFEVGQTEVLTRALEQFFGQQGMAADYAAYGEANLPRFELIELDGAKIASMTTSAGLHVREVLSPGELPGDLMPAGRRRLSSVRGQSLMDNPQLGRSLMALDSRGWGEHIEQATRQLQVEHGLSSQFVPLFQTLEETAAGNYQISLIKPGSPEELVRVSSSNPRLARIKTYLSELFTRLVAPRVDVLDPTHAGAVHTLNAGFAIQALMHALRAQEDGDKPLTLAVRLHAYVNYAQMAHGVAFDLVSVLQLVRQGLAQERLIAQATSTALGEALGHVANEGVGSVLALANVGFDIYQLSQAESDVEIAQFGTQLAFDSASALLAAAGLGAAALGAGTAAVALGGFSVILGGLAIGVGALAQGFAKIAEEAKQVGWFFHELEQGYKSGGYRWSARDRAWLPISLVVITSVDLRNASLTFDSPKLFPLRNHFGVPDYDVDYSRGIDIRSELGLPSSTPFDPPSEHAIMLPCTPKAFYGYTYKWLPGSSTRHDSGFDIARRLEKRKPDGDWLFLYSFWSSAFEYIVNGMRGVYRPTVVKVRLDEVARTLIVSLLPSNWHNLLTYQVEGGDAPCTLQLNRGVSLELEASGTQTMRWVLIATWATERDVVFKGTKAFEIGGLQVLLSGKAAHEIVVRLADNEVVRLYLAHQQLIVIEQSALPGMDERALRSHFRGLARDHRLAMPYTQVHQFVIPFEDPEEPRTTLAYYDLAQDRFLYVRDEIITQSENAVLGPVTNGFAYFFDPQGYDVWTVDVITGWIHHRNKLLLRINSVSTVSSLETVAGGGIKIVQTLNNQDGIEDVLVYLLKDDELLLCSMTRGLDQNMQHLVSAHPNLTEWSQVLGSYYARPIAQHSPFKGANWKPAPFVALCWKPASSIRDIVWVRGHDMLIIHPMTTRHFERGWPDSIKSMKQLMLLTPQGAEGDVFLIYDREKHSLCRRALSHTPQGPKLSVEWLWASGNGRLTDVAQVRGAYVVLAESGMFFNVTFEGQLQLGGLTETWFKDRPQWSAELSTVVTAYPSPHLALLGLSGLHNDDKLCAWYIDNRLLLADLGHREEVRLLGVTPDNTGGWLFDVSRGRVYRQAFIDAAQMTAAFGSGTKLLRADALPAPQLEWSGWVFADVRPQDAGLRATSRDGIELTLQDKEPALITGVDQQWVQAQGGTLSDSLKALVSGHDRYAALLTVAQPDRQQWFVCASGRLIEAPNETVPQSAELLGTQKRTSVVLYDNVEARLRRYPGGRALPAHYMQRTGEVLTIEGRGVVADLLPFLPDDVTTLVLRAGQGNTTYHVSRAAWLRLESVIVDCRPAAVLSSITSQLIWDLPLAQDLSASLVGEHLVIFDPDTCGTLILRQVNADDVSVRGEVLLVVAGLPSFTASSVVSQLSNSADASVGLSLTTLVAAASADMTSSAA